MATQLNRIVKRELTRTDNRGRKLIITLLPGDVLQFRSKGKRTVFEIPLGHCFNLALLFSLENQYRQRLKEYQLKKKAGTKYLKQPKRPTLFLNKIYSKAFA